LTAASALKVDLVAIAARCDVERVVNVGANPMQVVMLVSLPSHRSFEQGSA
jgi:hypothetical protein